MSLDSPTTVEKFIEQWKAFKYKNILLYVIIGLVAIGLVLYVVDYVSTVIHDRQRAKIQANLNVAMNELANVKSQANVHIGIDKALEAQTVANAQKALSDYQDSENLSDAAKSQTNASLANLANAKNTHNVNISIQDLERKLEEASK